MPVLSFIAVAAALLIHQPFCRQITAFSFAKIKLHACPTTARTRGATPRDCSLDQTASILDDKNELISTVSDYDTIEHQSIFDQFKCFILEKQLEIVKTLEEIDGCGKQFSKDAWGSFDNAIDGKSASNEGDASSTFLSSGGITRVLEGGDVIEKGAVSSTVIVRGKLTRERAKAIRARQVKQQSSDASDEDNGIQAGDEYSAAALSIVLHTRSPFIPTFRSDLRVFLVTPQSNSNGKNNSGTFTTSPVSCWFGGGADLTPYYIIDQDIMEFHEHYFHLCNEHFKDNGKNTYERMKKACDEYFYLPARSEHRGTGGIFFDDMQSTHQSLQFVKGVAGRWMPSWLGIVSRRKDRKYTEQQRQWVLLRRGRYLEFNLLYDRGVKFGLANANPRVEGVMVSAPPLIAWSYNHIVAPGSEEAKTMEVLKLPKSWIQ